MAKGVNKVKTYTNRFGEEVQGNATELDFYSKCEKALTAGVIDKFEYQVTYELIPPILDNHGTATKNTEHILDFILTVDNNIIAVDTKGGGAFTHDNTSKLKRLMWMQQHPGAKYYMISKASKYIGGYWMDSTSGNDLMTKVRGLYKKLYPWVVMNYQTKEDIKKNRFKKYENFPYKVSYREDVCPKFKPNDIHQYYDIFAVCGLFYSYTGKAKKRAKKIENPFVDDYEATEQIEMRL